MNKNKTSIFNNSLIWFGAGVSIVEILTGTFIAPLGFNKGMQAIVIGHIIGAILMYLAGIIGAKTEKSSMETTKIAFGYRGAKLFALLNIIQLIGWTTIMIYNGALSANSIINIGAWIWSIIITSLIIFWIVVEIRRMNIVNTITMGLLFILTIIMSKVVFSGAADVKIVDSMTFGMAVELSVAMPLSWLPLISDYTRNAKNKVGVTLASSVTYALVSIWMYSIGLGAAIFTGKSDIINIMLISGMGLIAVFIVVLSTVTTTFLDAYSAGISSESLSKKLNGKVIGIIVALVGGVLAIIIKSTSFENFLYFIGSVFAPMIAVQIADTLILKNDSFNKKYNVISLLSWLSGFIVYRIFMGIDTILGSTLPAMLVTIIVCIALNLIVKKNKSYT